MSTTVTYSLEDQIKEARRELAVRRKNYPRWIAQEQITQKLADERLGLQEAIIASLESFQQPNLFSLNGESR